MAVKTPAVDLFRASGATLRELRDAGNKPAAAELARRKANRAAKAPAVSA